MDLRHDCEKSKLELLVDLKVVIIEDLKHGGDEILLGFGVVE